MTAAAPAHFSFADRTAVIATMHRKETVMAPILEQELGLRVIVPDLFDTDRFGTFSREVERSGTQVEAARLKAKQAIEQTGATISLASEGSFVPHPAFPAIPCNRELVLLLDIEQDLELVGEAVSLNTNYQQRTVYSLAEAIEFAQAVGFPSHGLIAFLEPHSDVAEPSVQIIKGIQSESYLVEVVEQGVQTNGRSIVLETDMRALYNPTRMQVIAEATRNLVQKVNRRCPNCGYPGFDVVERRPGLPCALCFTPTELTLVARYHCQSCGFHQNQPFPDGRETADPSRCPVCNP